MIYLFIGIIIGVITASSVLFVNNLMTFYLAGEKFIPRSIISYARGGHHKRLARKHIIFNYWWFENSPPRAARKVVKLLTKIEKIENVFCGCRKQNDGFGG